jgi:heme exporter protein C
LPSAVFVTQDSIDVSKGESMWVNSKINNLTGKTHTSFPFLNILNETIRNTYYHVPFWFAMFIILIASVVMSLQYLRTLEADYDRKASALTSVGVLFGIIGLITGAIWAKHTWGAYWSFDVKQNTTAIGLLIYCAYFVLRDSFDDGEKKARISAVYNIFAFATLIPLLYVIPKLADSLHPGAGGNIPIGSLDLDSTMRLIFYPAIIGWTLFGVWMAELLLRSERLKAKLWDRI